MTTASGAIAFAAANPGVKVDSPVQRWGNPDLKTYSGAVNAALPLGEVAEAYADVVSRFLGEEKPMRFIEAVKPGFFKRLFGR